MQYPLISEYVEAIRMAEDNLDELTNLSSVLDDDGNPVMSSGNFAVVFKMKDRESGKLFALKCFTREQPAREENYLRITEELSYVSSPYILHVRYLPKELFVDTDQSNEDEFPILVMDWVEGQTLDAYLRDNIDNPSRLKKLSFDFNRMALWLLTQPFAHGDLKSDNIIVKSDGSLVLVDYDGMYVPAMKDRQSRETGSPNFRHPQRSEKWFDEYIDDFPLSLMATSLYALGLKPELLKEYNAKDAILFTEKDLLNLPQSKLYSALSAFLYDKTFAKLHSLMQLSLARVPIKGMYAPVIADLDARQDVYKSLFDKAMKLYKTSDDKTEAYRLFTQAATPYYLTQPMQIYCKTSEETEAEKRRIKLYTSSAENNDVTAQFILGECYYYGWGVEQDYKQAVAWYEQAAKQDNEAAKNRLKELLNPEITGKEYKEAITDEYGAKYTKDGLKLISVPTHLTSYTIKEGTKVIGGYYLHAFFGCTSLQFAVIPDGVTKIGASAFNGCTSLQSIIFPDSVTEIGGFNDCTSLQSVVIPDGVTKIGASAFSGCTSLQSSILPDGVTYIGLDPFSQSVVIPDGVTKIEGSMFYDSLRSIVLPDSVTKIGSSAFKDCTYLQSVVISDNIKLFFLESCTSLQSVTIPDSVTEIGEFSGCTSLHSVVIPDGVTEIGSSAFEGCTFLQTVVIPDGVTEIERSTFCGCTSLHSVVIPNGVTEIGSSAFEGCKSLQSVIIPDSVTYIGDDAFFGCKSLQSVIIPDSVTYIGDDAFFGCTSLQSVVIPDGVTKIGWKAFYCCTSLQSIVIPDGVTKIGDHAFTGCHQLTLNCKSPSFKVENNILYSKYGRVISFWSAEIKILTFCGDIPDGVTYIGDYVYVFEDCTSLQSIDIPDGVTYIGNYAFEDCTSLQSVVLPDSVTKIGESAFSGCTALQSVVIPDSVIYIGSWAFYGCTALQSVVLPNSGTCIGDYAFSGCTFLQSVVIPNGVTYIGESAFRGCTSLQSVVLSDSVIYIGSWAFGGCTSLQSVVIPNSVTYIGDRAFEGCTSLQSVIIPDSVTEIENRAFNGCHQLTLNSKSPFFKVENNILYSKDGRVISCWSEDKNIELPYGITGIGDYAFCGCTSLQSVVLPDGVTYIGDYAFRGCTSLQSVVIPDSVTEIGRNTFAYCSSLQPVVIPDGVTYIEIEDDLPF